MTDTAAVGAGARPVPRREHLTAWLATPAAAAIAFGAWLAVGFVVLLYVNRDQWFFGDEWATVNRIREVLPAEGWVEYLLRPHNEHWSTVPMLLSKLVFEAVGLRSYTVWLLPVLVAHLANATMVRVLVRRAGVAPWPATFAAGLLVLFGAGAENLVWAFQVGFVGSVTFGLVLVLVADRAEVLNRWLVIAWAAGVLSLASSGIGIPMVAAAAAGLAIGRRWRTLVAVVGPLVAVYAAWYVVADPVPTIEVTTYERADVLSYAWRGLVATADGVSGLALAGPVLLLALLAAVALVWPHLQDPGAQRVLGLAAGSLFLYLLTGLGRAGLGVEQATVSRYQYIAGVMLLPLATVVVTRLVHDRRPVAVLALGLLGWAVAANALALYRASVDRANINIRTKETVLAVASLAGLDQMEPGVRPLPDFNPDVTFALVAWLRDQGALPGGAVDPAEARRMAAVGAVAPDPAEAPTGAGPVQVVTQGAADVVAAGPGCVEVLPDGSGRAELWLQPMEVPVSVGVTSSVDTELGVVVRPVDDLAGAPGERSAVVLPAGASRPVVLSLDELLVLDVSQPVTVCGLQGP